ncbi:transcriptional regulator [Pasteurellaceae bacterium RH1A]|nr:transcriptional regulator [Pasteurellaceae bacterium RH1A]
MQEKETLSAYMDGNPAEGHFVDTLVKSPELQKTWASYHTIRSVMRGEEQLLGLDFSAKMEALIEQEQMGSETQAPKKGLLLKLKGWSTPLLQAGIAASVCLMAVVGVNLYNANSSSEVAQVEQPVLQTLPFTNTVQQVSYQIANPQQPTKEQLEYQQQRINELLQSHELQRHSTQPNK